MTTSSSGNRVGSATPSVDARACGHEGAARAAWQTVETALPGLRALQYAALGIYGRLEPTGHWSGPLRNSASLPRRCGVARGAPGWKKNLASSLLGCCAWPTSWMWI